jgi:hypothetical protein
LARHRIAAAAAARSADGFRRIQDHPRGSRQQPKPHHLAVDTETDTLVIRRSNCAAIRLSQRFMMEEWRVASTARMS